jgi:16S rRNA (cytidine1402-2'-O)-methyltransferase
MAGTLFVVATPIGHLDDITLRAIRVLKEVAVVAAEDTRRTRHLLHHLGIRTRLISLHEHNERLRSSALVDRLRQGESVALVSDAGTPGVSDPGALLVRRAREAGIRVESIPGASAVVAAVSVAGLEMDGFAFLGFPPIRSKDRKEWLKRLDRINRDLAVVFFEAPHRVRATLTELMNSVKQPILVARELTKVHEEVRFGTPAELLEHIQAPRGEFTIVVPQQFSQDARQPAPDAHTIQLLLGQTAKSMASKREAAREVARQLGLSTRDVYNLTKG